MPELVKRQHGRYGNRCGKEKLAGQVLENVAKGRTRLMLTETAAPTQAPSKPTQARTKMFLDIPTAAELAGFSIRHFRRIIEEDNIPIVQIGRKFFILGRDFASWETAKRDKRN